MKDAAPQTFYLSDYTPPAFLIDEVSLTFRLAPEATRVISRIHFVPNPDTTDRSFFLHGEQLKLISAKIDGHDANPTLTAQGLTAEVPDHEFTWEAEVEISPATNTALEGLYMSNGMYCTQCEAEGFRKITYYPDRPDVMAPFHVRIEGDLPVLLSNGNPVDQGDGWAEWSDPWPKPAYLFALVAGDLRATSGTFTTRSGNEVALNLWVRPGDESKTEFGLQALKDSMKWDEDVYGREYDLDLFNIVAVDDFNMGAMENKGLNIFNSSAVLASPETSTDANFERIEGIIAHAIEFAPDYRREKEELFLTTLSLIVERHEWGPRFFNTVSANLRGTPESGDFDTALDLVNSFRVTQRLPYGGTASVQALVNYTTLLQQASTNTGPDDTQDAAINASIDLPLLRGAGRVAREDIIQAERELVYAARDFERFRREFFVDIANTYFDLLRQQNGIDNQQLQLLGLEALADQLNSEAERGRVAQFEADDATAQVLFGESNLIRAQDNYQTALDRLKIRIGMPTTQPLTITREQFEIPVPALDESTAVPIALGNRLDLQTTRDRVDDTRRSALVSKNQLLGDLDLTAGLNLRTDRGADRGGLDFELEDSDYSLGLSYDVPLDRQIEMAQYRRSLVLVERAQRNYRVDRDRVALDVRDAIREIDRARLTVLLQERNIEFAERRLDGIRIRAQKPNENIAPRRIIEAEEDLLDARNSRDEAVADLQAAVLQYLLVTGQMRVGPDGSWRAPGTLLEAMPEEPAKAPAP